MSHSVTPSGFLTPATGLLPVAHGHPSLAFHGALYVTAAAVIPVLLLAVAVLGRLFWQVPAALAGPAGRPVTRRGASRAGPAPVLAVAGVIVVEAGLAGEAAAVTCLVLGHDVGGSSPMVALAALVLLAAVVASLVLPRATPTLRWVRARVRLGRWPGHLR